MDVRFLVLLAPAAMIVSSIVLWHLGRKLENQAASEENSSAETFPEMEDQLAEELFSQKSSQSKRRLYVIAFTEPDDFAAGWFE